MLRDSSRHYEVSVAPLAQQTGISFPTASKPIRTFVDMSIARELTGQRLN